MNDEQSVKPVSWVSIVNKYNKPDHTTSWWQLSSNLLLLVLAWVLLYLSLSVSYWITLALIFPTAGILVRLFIIFHDCGHGTFFSSRKLRDATGVFIGILTFTPYFSWHHNHHIHHETAGNLDKRGVGDVWTLTVDEYLNSSQWQRIVYRFYRHPITMFLIGTLYVFLIGNRFTKKYMDKKCKRGVYITNAGLLLYGTVMSLLFGFEAFALIQLLVIYVAAIMGFWLFYVQHQFDRTYWAREKSWDYKRVALEGSSFYKLPGILRWFTGNIGYHHIHHLSPLIPNYSLRKCHKENEIFREVKPVTFWVSLRSMTYRLWHEQTQTLISFRKIKSIG
jgi:omega-6 fatty acid desaturase (delta-12 desaturase)